MSKPTDSKFKMTPLSADTVEFYPTELELTPSNGKPFIEELFKKTNTKEIIPLEATIQLLGRYGLQSPLAVIKFLESPTGTTIEALIHKQLVLLAGMRITQQQHYRDEQLRKHRFLALLFLAILYKKKAEAKKLRELHRQLEKLLTQSKTTTEQLTTLDSAETEEQALKQTYAMYDMSAQLIEMHLEEKIVESEKLERDILALEKQGESIETRYYILNKGLQTLENHADTIEHLSSDEEKITKIEQEIAAVNKQIDEKRATIDKLVASNQDDEAFDHLHELNGLNVQQAGLQDMLAVIKHEKAFYTAEGELVNSYNKADYILSYEQKIVKENGYYYLIPKAKQLSELDSQQKQQAQQKYEHAKPLKTLIENNKGVETNFHNERSEEAYKRISAIREEILDFANQLNHIQSVQASVAAKPQQSSSQANQGDASQTLTLSLKPSPKAPSRSSEKTLTSSYRRVLELIKIEQKPNKQFTQAMQTELATILADSKNKPLNPVTMNLLLATMERFGVLANKPNVTSIKSPLAMALHPEPQPNPVPTPTPSPLRIKPY